MFITEFFEAQGNYNIVVTYPGRFQPFHLGHAGVFAKLQKEFGRDSVYILTSNDQSSPKSPFNYTDKYHLITAAGIHGDRIVETNQMYSLPAGFDPSNTIFVTAVGSPDAQRLGPDTYLKRDNPRTGKKAGDPSYFKTWQGKDNAVPADQHGYVIIVNEIHKAITIKGKKYDVSHGTDCRNLWNAIRNDQEARVEFLTQLYGRATPELAHIFDKIPAVQEDSNMPVANDSISPIHGGTVAEGEVVPMTRGAVPNDYELALKLARRFLSYDESAPDAHQTMGAILAKLNSMGYSLQSTLNPKHDGLDLVNKSASFRQYIPYKINEDASGYIPKNEKEAKDPRWERALSVDVHPDTMKKELAAFFPTKAPKTQQKQVTESMLGQINEIQMHKALRHKLSNK